MYHPTHVSGELLQATDVDGSLFGGKQIASSDAKIAGRANHAASEAKRIVRKYGLGSAIIILVRYRSYERFDVQLRGTRFLTGSIGALETTRSLVQGSALAQSRVLDVVEIFGQRSATL